ncbi:MAG: LuxR C-terminal-related transcriptional regulator [Panacagrimonas sp.]
MPDKLKMPVVSEAKLYAGVGAAQALPRPGLLPSEAVLAGQVPVVVVCAPAGYGKSTLLSAWHRHFGEHGIACGWLNLDADDDDPARLMRHLVAAFQRIDAGIGLGALEELAADFANGARPALESLAGDLARRRKRAVIFLDDHQFLSAPQSIGLVEWLLNYSPPTCQYVIGTRGVTQLRLGGLRVRGKLVELGIEELRFTEEEAERFVRARLDRTIPTEDTRRLARKVEGWPAAMELATLALLSGADRATVIDRFSGSDVNVVDYLGEVVLDRLDQRTRAFVLNISLFDRISADLAQEVTDEHDARRLLSGIHKANLFLTPLDRNAEWYRFHPLAAEFLRERFRRDLGDPAPLVRRGALWLYGSGHAEAAINAAIDAADWESAASWIAASVEELVYRRGYHQTILRWMKKLPAEWVDRFPAIRIHYAFALAFSPLQDEVDAQVYHLERLRARMLEQPYRDLELCDRIACEVELQKVLSVALRDDGLSARQGAEAWLERWPNAPLIRRGTVANVLTFGLKTAGEIEQARTWNVRARQWLLQVEGWYSLAWTQYIAAILNMKAGAYFEARQDAEAGLELLRRHLDGHPGHAALLHTVLATVAYEFDEITLAEEHLERCMPRVAEAGQSDAVLMGFLTAAKVERLRRGEAAGVDKLHEGQELGERRGLRRVTVSLAAEECGWHSRAGRYEEARQIAARHGFAMLPGRGDVAGLRGEKAFLVGSRYQLRSQPREVLRLIDTPLARCRDKGLHRRRVELLLLRALAFRQSGDQKAAMESLGEALAIAAQRNYYRVILDEAADLAVLFEQIDPARMRGSEAAPLARRLQKAMREARAADGAPLALPKQLIGQLSKRELAILRRLDSDLSPREIADAIFISEGTLRWHLHNIYGKLAVKNRSGAVSKARALALL